VDGNWTTGATGGGPFGRMCSVRAVVARVLFMDHMIWLRGARSRERL
jgi:hypothetical protein